jgi:hypothetical protein
MNLQPKVPAQSKPEAGPKNSIVPLNVSVSVIVDETENRAIETRAILLVYDHENPEQSRLLIKYEGGRGVFVPLKVVTFL